MSTDPRLWWLCIRLRESLCAVYYSDVHWSESNIKSFTAQGVSYKISPLFRFVCERNTLWFLNTFLQHFKNNCFLHHRHTHNQPHLPPSPPSTLLSIKLTLSLWQLAAHSGRCAGQRVMWHLPELCSPRQPSYSPVPHRSDVTCSLLLSHLFLLLFLSRLYFRMTHRFP